MADRRADRPFKALAGAALALGLAVLPGAAQAQVFGGWGGWDNGGSWDGLGPQQVRRAISQRGFRVLAPLRRNGNVFVADVLDGRGQHERLIVAAADAQILQRFMVDDGRQPGAFPRGTDDGRDFTARGTDDDRGLVPPGDIPDAGRRAVRPVDRDVAPPQRFGDLAPGDDAPATLESPLRRTPPPIRTAKPRPHVVERTPEVPVGGREPGPVEATPLAPAPRPAVAAPVPAPVAKAPAAAPAPAPAVVASRPEPSAAPMAPAPAPPAAPATASRRMTDPLAIPAGGDAKPVRNVATGITGTPTPAPATPAAKPGDVPVAPLD